MIIDLPVWAWIIFGVVLVIGFLFVFIALIIMITAVTSKVWGMHYVKQHLNDSYYKDKHSLSNGFCGRRFTCKNVGTKKCALISTEDFVECKYYAPRRK